MTRNEEILNKAIDYSEIEDNFMEYDDCGDVCNDMDFIEKAFISGATWADETFLKKTCEFIRKGGMRGDGYIVTEFGEEVFDFIQFAEDFRKYMEGE